jgi:signal transduction histidine kinase
VLPILHHGALSAMLMLQMPGSSGEFSPAARAAIEGIAGPLAVSLENVLLYERLEQHVAERTRELRETQEALVATARRAGMAEIATNVLHNVGNTLNSVNVAAELMRAQLDNTRSAGLSRAADLLDAQGAQLATFLQDDERGRVFPRYLRELSNVLLREREELAGHLDHLTSSVDHIKMIVATQQAYAGPAVMSGRVVPAELVEDALRIANNSLRSAEVQVVMQLAQIAPVMLDKTRTLQILVNLLDNASQSMTEAGVQQPVMTIRTMAGGRCMQFVVCDNGCGIAQENLTRIFAHGFTTRAEGHGFGLHGCALAAVEMGGSLTVQSDGLGQGATFTLELPLVIA